jgi:tryptophan-rich sensory protein
MDASYPYIADRSQGKYVFRITICLLACFGAAALGAAVTSMESLHHWYHHLQKPAVTPPDWVFGPVWTILYSMMAFAAFLVWNRGLDTRHVKAALALFAVQLALNAAWTPLFFGLHFVGWALVDVIALAVVLTATIAAFVRVSRPAAALLVPYLLWTVFAAILNGLIYKLNT